MEMGVLNVQMGSVGLAGVTPRVVYIDTNDTLATVTTAGYLNHLVQQGYAFSESDMCCVTTRTTPNATVIQVAWLEVSFVSPNWSLVPTGSPGQVVLPTTINAIVHATNATGTLSTAAASVFNLGNISAGQSGTAGALISFPATPANGFLNIQATANGGARNAFITNAVLGQTTTFIIPDPGTAFTSFLLTDSAGTQTIATGNLALTVGTLTLGSSNHASSLTIFPPTASRGFFEILPIAAAGAFNTIISNAAIGQTTTYTIPDAGVATTSFLLSNSAGTQTIATGSLQVFNGNVLAGAVTPHAGNFQSFPAASGGANDKFVIAAVTTGGNFTSTLSNGTQGQTTVFTLPDPVNALARVLVGATATPFTANHSLVASGTGGLIADAGYQMKTVAIAAVAGGAAAQTVTDAFCTSTSCVVACWNDTTNAVNIQTVAAGNGSFVVTSSADPGASHISYIITKV